MARGSVITRTGPALGGEKPCRDANQGKGVAEVEGVKPERAGSVPFGSKSWRSLGRFGSRRRVSSRTPAPSILINMANINNVETAGNESSKK